MEPGKQETPYPPANVEIKLSRPVTVAGKTVDTITLREPTMADAEFLDRVRFKFDQDGNGEVLGMGTTCLHALVYLGGLTHNEAKQVSSADVMKIWTTVMGFLINSRGTGASQ